MDVFEIGFKLLEVEIEERKHKLQILKEEMKDLLFEEFIEKQGDFINVEIPKFNTERMNNLITVSNPKTEVYGLQLYFTDEEKALIKSDTDKSMKSGNHKYSDYSDISKEIILKRHQEYEEYQEEIKTLKIDSNEILKHFSETEFEERFWKYISDNGGFRLKENVCVCSKCGKVPIVRRKQYWCSGLNPDGKKIYKFHSVGFGIFGIQEFRDENNKTFWKSNTIIYITCCKFLYNFEEKKMYKYPGIFPYLAKIDDFINKYIPCEEYDFKTKKDLWEEMQLMKERLSKIEIILSEI
jgi:hypothetical protein